MGVHVLVDTGPLVALFDARDKFHSWAVENFKQIQPPLLTCEAVLVETCFLLQRVDPGRARLVFDWIPKGLLDIPFTLVQEHRTIQQLMEKYADVPMSVADACLVRMSELYEGAKVFSIDTDFIVYRKHRTQAIPLIHPFE